MVAEENVSCLVSMQFIDKVRPQVVPIGSPWIKVFSVCMKHKPTSDSFGGPTIYEIEH